MNKIFLLLSVLISCLLWYLSRISFITAANSHTITIIISNVFFVAVCVLFSFLEYLEYTSSKMTVIHKTFISFKVRRRLKKVIPTWWMVKKISYLSMNYIDNEIEVYVELKSLITPKNNDYFLFGWVNGYVKTSPLGDVLSSSTILSDISLRDHLIEDIEKKKFTRDDALSKLGIK